ncbi:hypothetical protein QBC35DRAFT_221335 [Podospora australis]|uniref:Cupin type-1 domain-containing protein n=1 Tax=Podospora australis TaxID=1536484 RepID=A0AAN6WT96_9PEZI|nr:hypothetical protein QBC35DRAFT_221335 [Podospora australis]
MRGPISFLTLVIVTRAAAAETSTSPPPLNITALSSRNGYSVLECWQLSSIPVDAMSAANYAVGGNTTQAVWSRIEPRTHIGEAWAPHVQLSIILNGLIRITSPAPEPNASIKSVSVQDGLQAGQRPDSKVAYIMPGTLVSSVLIAADLKSLSTIAGHFTEFPSGEPTILVQIPFEGDRVPEHKVLHEGACLA